MEASFGSVRITQNSVCFAKKSVNVKQFLVLQFLASPNFKDVVEKIWRPTIYCQTTKSFVL